MAQIETIIEGLKQLQERWITSVTRAKEDRNEWGSYIRIEETETEAEDWNVSEAVIEVSNKPFKE